MHKPKESQVANARNSWPDWYQEKESTAVEAAAPTPMENPAVQISVPVTQPKLEIDPPESPAEQEADQVAEEFVQASAGGADPPREQTNSQVSKFSNAPVRGIAPPEGFAAQLNAYSGTGEALGKGMKQDLEGNIGRDLSEVRVHTDAGASELSRSIDAQAFTSGNDIFFGENHYQPDTQDGKRLIAHEVTHTLQQGGSQGKNRVQAQRNPPTDPQTLTGKKASRVGKVVTTKPTRLDDLEELQLSGSVGTKQARNHPVDVLQVQTALLKLGYEFDRSEIIDLLVLLRLPKVEESRLPTTIEAIKEFQMEKLGWQDGNIGADGKTDVAMDEALAEQAREKAAEEAAFEQYVQENLTPMIPSAVSELSPAMAPPEFSGQGGVFDVGNYQYEFPDMVMPYTVTRPTSIKLSGGVGIKGENNPYDVKQVQEALLSLGLETEIDPCELAVVREHLVGGKYAFQPIHFTNLGTTSQAITEFQTREKITADGTCGKSYTCFKRINQRLQELEDKIKQEAADKLRRSGGGPIPWKPSGELVLTNSVGTRAQNQHEDVKSLIEALYYLGEDIDPQEYEMLLTCSEGEAVTEHAIPSTIAAIKSFQKKSKITQDGNISLNGTTDGKIDAALLAKYKESAEYRQALREDAAEFLKSQIRYTSSGPQVIPGGHEVVAERLYQEFNREFLAFEYLLKLIRRTEVLGADWKSKRLLRKVIHRLDQDRYFTSNKKGDKEQKQKQIRFLHAALMDFSGTGLLSQANEYEMHHYLPEIEYLERFLEDEPNERVELLLAAEQDAAAQTVADHVVELEAHLCQASVSEGARETNVHKNARRTYNKVLADMKKAGILHLAVLSDDFGGGKTASNAQIFSDIEALTLEEAPKPYYNQYRRETDANLLAILSAYGPGTRDYLLNHLADKGDAGSRLGKMKRYSKEQIEAHPALGESAFTYIGEVLEARKNKDHLRQGMLSDPQYFSDLYFDARELGRALANQLVEKKSANALVVEVFALRTHRERIQASYELTVALAAEEGFINLEAATISMLILNLGDYYLLNLTDADEAFYQFLMRQLYAAKQIRGEMEADEKNSPQELIDLQSKITYSDYLLRKRYPSDQAIAKYLRRFFPNDLRIARMILAEQQKIYGRAHRDFLFRRVIADLLMGSDFWTWDHSQFDQVGALAGKYGLTDIQDMLDQAKCAQESQETERLRLGWAGIMEGEKHYTDEISGKKKEIQALLIEKIKLAYGTKIALPEIGLWTFVAEVGEDPRSQKSYGLHWPGGNSGVTIGAGYDLKERDSASVYATLTGPEVGIDPEKAKIIAQGAGLSKSTSPTARTFVNENAAAVGKITAEQRRVLFEIVYADKVEAAKGRATNPTKYAASQASKAHALTESEWEALPMVLKEFVVDLTYQGMYTEKNDYFPYWKLNKILKSEDSEPDKINQVKKLVKLSARASGGKTRMNHRISLLDRAEYDFLHFFDSDEEKEETTAEDTLQNTSTSEVIPVQSPTDEATASPLPDASRDSNTPSVATATAVTDAVVETYGDANHATEDVMAAGEQKVADETDELARIAEEQRKAEEAKQQSALEEERKANEARKRIAEIDLEVKLKREEVAGFNENLRRVREDKREVNKLIKDMQIEFGVAYFVYQHSIVGANEPRGELDRDHLAKDLARFYKTHPQVVRTIVAATPVGDKVAYLELVEEYANGRYGTWGAGDYADLVEFAIENVNNTNDKRLYSQDAGKKSRGTHVDCSHFVREVLATLESPTARDIKADEGRLTVSQMDQHSVFFSQERLAEARDKKLPGNDGRLTRLMWLVFEEHGQLFREVEEIQPGDIVFTGPGTERTMATVKHIVICTSVEIVNGERLAYFAHAGVSDGGRSVQMGMYKGAHAYHHIEPNGAVWKGDQYFKGVGKLP